VARAFWILTGKHPPLIDRESVESAVFVVRGTCSIGDVLNRVSLVESADLIGGRLHRASTASLFPRTDLYGGAKLWTAQARHSYIDPAQESTEEWVCREGPVTIQSEEHWFALVDAFHSAALGEGTWEGALQGLAHATGSRSSQLIGRSSDLTVLFNLMTNVDPAVRHAVLLRGRSREAG
jgi:hypothetical protein